MADKRTQLETVIQTGIDSALKELHTCFPAVVTRVDHSTQLIDAQITIKRKLSGVSVELPLLTGVPIRYFKVNKFSITAPIEIGDEVLLIFSERSIDTWLIEGGIQNPFDFRKHSLSDAFALPMMYSQKNVIPNFDSSNLEIKTNTGDTKIIIKVSEDIEIVTTGEIKADCDTATINASTKIDATTPIFTINGNLQVNGTISSTGKIESDTTVEGINIVASNSMTVQGKEMHDHKHSQGNDNDGDVEQDTSGPI